MEKTNLILNEYKKYDYLNGIDKKPLVKILVSYIKPSFLFKSKILTPIQLGRAIEKENSKDGIQSHENLKWLHENCEFNDDFKGGISKYNRRVGFLTGTYWAWKNYEKLGSPEYFGSFGYRRLLNADYLQNIKQYDAIIPKPTDFTLKTYKEHFISYSGIQIYNAIINVLNSVYPKETNAFENYINNTKVYLYENYVFKQELFFEFCSWIFPLMFEALNLPHINHLNDKYRDVAYIIEALNGYWINKLKNNKNLKIIEVDVENPYQIKSNKNVVNKDMFSLLRKHISI